jgi:uncharacterized protein (DUF488 family)
MKPRIVTIGVYGFDEDRFFQALLEAGVDTFCDIRLRRGMRGSEYAFVNSTRLQRKLSELGIRYIHLKDLAPSQAIRERQKEEDNHLGIAKRTRTSLGQAFVEAYQRECLAHFDSQEFLEQVGQGAEIISLFCVEHEPEACHRSLAAKHLAHDLGLHIEHIKP